MSINDCEKDLARLIHVIVEQGNYVEDARIELANNSNFSPFAAFRTINGSATGFLTRDDLEDFLRQNGLALQPETLNQFFTVEKDKSYRITYNDFLNQVLPSTDIDLRNACLERPHRAIEGNAADVDRLITAVYQKANEYTRTLEATKKKLSTVNNQLLEKVFQCLADDVTGYLSFKSISAFMKQNNFTFERKDYERFMNKIDRNLTGRITPIDFKYLMFPHGTLTGTTRDYDLTHRKAESIFSGISPIKNWNSSPNKGSTRKPLEASLLGENERSLLALKNKSNAHSPHDKIPREYDRKSHIGSTFNPSAMKSGNKQGSAPDTRAVLYNKEIAAINDHIILQNAPETTYQDKNSKNPLEWRYLDPVYHNYWSYHRDHNRTLSPDYFSRANGHTLSQKHRSHNPARPGTNFVPFFNPTFVDPGTYENLERYPDNPFRYTDHGHFFKNYYANLRHNYYDQYYNYVPYKTKVPSGKSEINSRDSPQKTRPQSQRNSPQRYQAYPDLANFEVNEQRPTNTLRRSAKITTENVGHSDLPLIQYPQQPRELPGRLTRGALGNQESQPANNAPYQFVYVPGPEDQQDNEPKSAIRLEKQSYAISPKLNQDPLSNYAFGRPGGQVADDFGNKPYTFVVANK